MLAYLGYLLGHSSVAQRVQDTLGVLASLRARPDVDPDRVALLGIGGGAIVALHAAALDGRLCAVAAVDALATYRSIVEAPRYAHSVADFVPGALLAYDLPSLAAALAPARVLMLHPQDAAGDPLTPPLAQATYGEAQRLAALLGGDLQVETPASPHRGAPDAARARRDAILNWVSSPWP
jgi:hypothetical protein